MDFDFSEAQKILRRSAREFLSSACTAALVREVEEEKQGYAGELWRRMAELGWMGLAVPEEFGGSGGSFFDVCLLVEELGRALAPVPFVAVTLCEYALLEGGSEAQRERFLPRLTSGELKMTVAVDENELMVDPWSLQTRAVRDGNHYVLDGTKNFVPYATVADAFLVAARTGAAGDDSLSLLIVERQAPGVEVSPLSAIASDGLGQVSFSRIRLARDHLLEPEGNGWSRLKNLYQRGAILKCAEMVGGAQWVLDRTVEYAKERVQFDRPIGSFQAIQHRCANMAMSADGARFVTYQAAWLQSENLACEREVAIAKAWASEAYTRICLDSHQAHGAIGFTKDYDLQLYTRRAKAAEVTFGDARHHYEALANLMGL